MRAFMAELEKRGLLKRIKVEVDANLEITEISDRVVKSGGPALLFENVKGYQIPVVTNLFGTLERMKLALNVDNLDQVGEALLEILQPPDLSSLIDKLKALPRLAQLSSFLPKTVKSGPCKEVIIKDNPSLAMLPVLKCWPEDGGPFITLPLVFTKDPETGRRNVGMYRMQVYDERTTGMHWHIHKDGAEHFNKCKSRGNRMPVAVALGADPAVIFSAAAPLPAGIDEMIFAGFLRKEPVELVRCETVDVDVPAKAEIILEGYVDPWETRLEGPFGDHTGYYSLADYYPVFHLTCITHRKNPVYPATIVGRPPMEDAFIGKAVERIFLPLIRLQLPEVKDMNMPPEGVFHNCVIVSIKKRYPGQAKKVMSALWGMGLMMLAKLIIVVDEDVNVQNISEVMWRVFNNIDAGRDVMMVEGPVDALDHSSPLPHLGTKMGIDATRKWPSEGHLREWPRDIIMSEDVKKEVDRKWEKYGI
ncbi:3-polyprenyl-4-hydroxybenzoate decarboxylase and related decarboxylases [Pelotomaculum thermopropionicum SI]|uniref:3-polyprenyl-4-hydroxybenzoate decarboxylase and related decarboxylases n=1 Tax=Pelotomaculum thermopropionicum (strain DSM 13744 / JCM 10971 / SI) TaxID=370438 RepID=A5D2A4_PELTS|nr:3-polyprenyl-4-hydroxybenzoate decarboxylase and related decarboxylases [Pelotomaculum thermopropionicum SI]